LKTLSVEKEEVPLARAGENNLRWALLIPWGLLALAVALFFVRAYQYGGFFAEDAYVSFRFADNLANGHGLVWNIGQEPVEGYTSPLHIALLALGIKMGLPIALLATLIGFLSLAGLVGIYLMFLRKELGQLTITGAVVISIFLIDARLAVHATAGLDTVLFMLLLAASFAVSVYFVTSTSWLSAGTLAVTNLLALLGRPDAAPFIAGQAVVILAYALYQYCKQKNVQFGLYAAFSYSLLLTLGIGYLAWKLSYFGYLLPNPFYIKANDPLALHGAFSVAKFGVVSMSRYGLILLPALFFINYSRVQEWLRPSATRVKAALLLVPSIASLLYYLTVLPEVNYLSRFEYPTLIFFCLAGAILLSVGAPFQNLRTRASKMLHPKLVLVVFAVAVVLFSAFIYRVTQVYFPWFQIVEEGFYRPIGEALKSTGLGPEATLVFDSAGVVPFTSQFTHIDPVGLTDNVLSGREPISVWERESYIWGQNPDVYIGPEPPASPGAAGCTDDRIVQSRYVQSVLLGDGRPNINGAYLHVYGEISAEETCEILHSRMRELRDRWHFVGEVPYPVPVPPEFTMFAYVRTNSPHYQQLVTALEPIIGREPSEMDFFPAPR
jgi:hypothetical protein